MDYKVTKTHRAGSLLIAFSAMGGLVGCATGPDKGSLLGTSERSDRNLFVSPEKEKECLSNLTVCISTDRIPVGMPKAEVFKTMGLNPAALGTMNKQQIQSELYGNTLTVSFEHKDEAQTFMNALEGYSAAFHDVRADKRFGMISEQVETKGLSVTFNIVFKDGRLFNKISMVGEPVNKTTRKGYLSGATIQQMMSVIK